MLFSDTITLGVKVKEFPCGVCERDFSTVNLSCIHFPSLGLDILPLE